MYTYIFWQRRFKYTHTHPYPPPPPLHSETKRQTDRDRHTERDRQTENTYLTLRGWSKGFWKKRFSRKTSKNWHCDGGSMVDWKRGLAPGSWSLVKEKSADHWTFNSFFFLSPFWLRKLGGGGGGGESRWGKSMNGWLGSRTDPDKDSRV